MIKISKEHETYYNAFLEDLKNVAHPNFPGSLEMDTASQKEIYLNFAELVECFIGSCEVIMTWPVLSREQIKELETLYDMVLDYDDDCSTDFMKTDDEIRNDPEWSKVRKFAAKVHSDLKQVQFM